MPKDFQNRIPGDISYDQLLQLIPAGIGIFTVSGNTEVYQEYISEGYAQLLGTTWEVRKVYAGAEALGPVLPEDLPKVLQEIRQCLAENRPLSCRFRILFGDNTYKWVFLHANHIPVDDKTERFFSTLYDINDFMKMKEQLQENQKTFVDLLSYSEVLYIVYYPDRHYYEIPFLPEVLHDLPPAMDDFPEKLMEYAGFSEKDKVLYREMISKIDAGEKEAECTIHFRYHNVYTWYRVHFTSHVDENGHVEKAFGYAINVDHEKAAEKLIAEERLHMKTMASGMLAISCFNVTQDRSIDINNTKDLHYDSITSAAVAKDAEKTEPGIRTQHQETKDILLSAADDIPDPQQRKTFIATCSHAGMTRLYDEGKREVHLEYRRYTGKGLIWVHTRIALLPDPETGDVLAFYYTSDINEQKIRQEVLGSLIEQYFDFTTYIDLRTHLIRMVKSKENPLALPPVIGDYDEINNKYIPIYVHPQDQADCCHKFNLAYIREQLQAAPTYSIYYRLIDPAHPEAPPRLMRMLASYLNSEKQYIVFSRTDITEQVAKEEQQKAFLADAVRRANSANAAKSNFLARMSHDIRTPLNGIMGMTSLALEKEMPPPVRTYLEKIDESSHFLLSLINDILDMSKVESGKLELHLEHYRYKELQDYLTSVIEPLCQAKDITFTVTYPATTYTLLADKVRFNQILFNLLSNAVKFTPRKGHVRLDFQTSAVTVDKLTLDITVCDDGIGMSPEFQKKLFQPFEQEHNDSTSVRSGSGLGLAIVKSLVDLMAGKISVNSTYGHGSEFHVTLPFTIVPDVDEPVLETPLPVSLAGKHILIAEDNAINGEIVMSLLQNKGALTTLAVDGNRVVKQYADSEQYHYDMILMDIQMPHKNGLSATREIRQLNRPDAKVVPIIAMTANAFDEDVKICKVAGMDAHIAKPIDTKIFFRTIAEWLDK